MVYALLAIASAAGRGVLAALAGLTKFVPLALGPLFLRGRGPSWPRPRSIVIYVLAYALTLAVAMLPVLLDDNLRAFWHDTIVYQANRVSPFSVWGLWGGLSVEQHLVQGAAVVGLIGFPDRYDWKARLDQRNRGLQVNEHCIDRPYQ